MSCSVQPLPAAGQTPSRFYVPETGHTLAEPVLGFWTAQGGTASFGLPVTESLPSDRGRIQFFQLGAVLVRSAKPEVALDSGQEVLAARRDTGLDRRGRRAVGVRDSGAFRRSTQRSDRLGQRTFVAASGYALGGQIGAFYALHGGARRFGLPLSQPYQAGGMSVQWFASGRLEARQGSRAAVHVGHVGSELAALRGLPTESVQRRGVPLLNGARRVGNNSRLPIPDARYAFSPVALRIPRIGVDAAIERARITRGVMQPPRDPWQVAWYPAIAVLGHGTNVVLAGHKDWWNIGPTIFADLAELAPGDTIYLIGPEGAGFTYRVTASWVIDAGADPKQVIRNTGVESLTLFTCAGTFDGNHYLSRLVVRAERMKRTVS